MTHEEKVERVRAQLAGGAAHIDKGTTRHFVPRPGDTRRRGRAVDVSALNEILSIDGETCTAEPGATFAEVVRATLARGLLPKVVPELEGITLGGAVAGCSVESMSYRYGGFHDTCTEYEVVTGTGERRTFTPDDELFHMLHGSYGTLAILTRITFELIPAEPYVALEYRRFDTYAAYEAALRAEPDHDFVDGIVHAPDNLVLCAGRFVAEGEPTRPEIFYRSTAERDGDVMTTYDYCFRYDRECHWLSRTVPALEWRPVRRAVGRWFLGSENLIRWSGRLGRLFAVFQKRPDVVVDVFIPVDRLAEFWAWYVETFDYWPLWIVPYRVAAPYPWLRDGPTGLMVDCAVYGKRNNGAADLSEAIERKTYELGGIKTLISRNHHTREQFWSVYDSERWAAAKSALDPGGVFQDLYEKFHGGGD